jgi:hypothetical protein
VFGEGHPAGMVRSLEDEPTIGRVAARR